MRYLATGEQMKAVDRYTIETIGIPSLVLMERAAMAVAREAENLAKKIDIIWAVCGTGNNGADGVAAARMLTLKGYKVLVIIAGREERGTREFHAQMEIARNLGIPAVEWRDFRETYQAGHIGGTFGGNGVDHGKLFVEGDGISGTSRTFRRCDVIIDGVFGVGLAREVEGEYREILKAMGDTRAAVVAVDIPSGIHSTTGQVMGIALKADVTVTFGCEKLGSVLYPGRDYCGKLVVEDIGFPKISFEKSGPFAWTYDREDLTALPPRPAYSNKGTFGKVLLIAGCAGMSGAAFLAALAAYRTGAGLVKIMTVEENRAVLQQQLPEAIVTTYRPEELTGTGGRGGNSSRRETNGSGGIGGRGEGSSVRDNGLVSGTNRMAKGIVDGGAGLADSFASCEDISQTCSEAWEKRMERECAWADVIAVGPGLGQEPYVRLLIQSVLTSAYVPIILDADGLNTMAKYPYLEQYYTENIVITPHLGEMARLTGKTIGEIQKDIIGTAHGYSSTHGVVCALKDAATVVTGRDGQCYVNTSGNSCMAKAGSGDVLAGTVAGLLAQKMEPFDGAAMAVYIHGLAGDRYRENHGQSQMLARELAGEIGEITREAERR